MVAHALWAALLALLVLVSPVAAQPNYVSSEIPAPEWPQEIVVADVNGNGRKDLIVPGWSPQAGRELEVFLQQADGRFSDRTSRRVPIAPEVVAVSLANVRPMPGKELLLITDTAVFARSALLPDEEPEKLFAWDFMAAVPHRRRTLFYPAAEDVTGNGAPDLLLPGREHYGLFGADAEGELELIHSFATRNEALAPWEAPASGEPFTTDVRVNQREGLLVELVPRSSSAFEGFLEDRRERSVRPALLSVHEEMPGAVLARMRPGSGKDIVFINTGEDLRPRINVLSPQEDGTFPERPQWQGPAHEEGDYRLMDLNGNGLMDIVRIKEESNEWDVYFHVNRDGELDLEQADQRMRFSGYDLRLSVQDIDGDGRPGLSVTYYTIPATAMLRDARIERTQLLYGASGAHEGRLFNTRPDSRLEERFSADAVSALYEPMRLQADLSNDGRIDALYLTGDGTLAARAIDERLRIADEPFWQYVPERTIIGFDVRDLNGDGQADFLLHHSTKVTVLISVQR